MKLLLKYHFPIIFILVFIGFFDATYLTLEHLQHTIPPCTVNPLLGNCGKVLQSSYSVVFGVPLAAIGVFHYLSLLLALVFSNIGSRKWSWLVVILSVTGFLGSLYFVYLQLAVIHAFCIFCMVSALTSTLLFLVVQLTHGSERKQVFLGTCAFLYIHVVKYFLFKFNAETIHFLMVRFGEIVGNIRLKSPHSKVLKQTVAGIEFSSPIGLAAGFDYEARLTQVLPSIGFGFETVGTITNNPYGGNPGPMLGRLPKSKSLMVNKGFKNKGAINTISKLEKLQFQFPVGISIGRTNTKALTTQKQSITDIVHAFTLFEKSQVSHAYYELNISCPNLYGNITFYPPKNLDQLLTAIDALHLSRPVFIKMPIEKTDSEVLAMLKVIAKHSPVGVIFGNLQKDRTDPTFDIQEIQTFPVGNFSGKPTYERSNQLIALTYAHYKKRFVIIGCGGVFSAADAYEKIKLGATLVQLITGMIYQGPQLISQINTGLVSLIEKDGFSHISEAIGTAHKK